MIGPQLHHLPTFGKMGGPVVGAAIRITHRMRQLMLDEIWANTKHFVQDGPCHGSESVSGDIGLGVIAHATQSSICAVIAHGAVMAPFSWENKPAAASQRVQFAQYQDCLPT